MGAFDLRKAQGTELYEKILRDAGADAARVAKGNFELLQSKAGFYGGRILKGLSYFGLVRGSGGWAPRGATCAPGNCKAAKTAATADAYA